MAGIGAVSGAFADFLRSARADPNSDRPYQDGKHASTHSIVLQGDEARPRTCPGVGDIPTRGPMRPAERTIGLCRKMGAERYDRSEGPRGENP